MNITGTANNDTLTGGTGDDVLDGGAGNDTLDGGAHTGTYGDWVKFAGATTGVTVDLAAGTATDGQGGADTLVNIEGMYDTPFDDVLKGNAGRNLFILTAGNDAVDGRDGSDGVAYAAASSGVTVNLLTGTASGSAVGTDTLVSIENAFGSYFDDTITMGNFEGGTAYGRAGNDLLTGGTMSDNFSGGSGNDTMDGKGGSSDAVFYSVTTSDGGTKALTGLGVTVNLATGVATDNWGDTDTLVGIEFVEGSTLNDTLVGGNPLNDAFEGFRGLAGNDLIDGGSGFDRVFYETSPAAVTVVLGGTNAGTAADGWGNTDTLLNIESVRGSSFDDTLTGSDSAAYESFEGRAGNDTIDGKGGRDRVEYRTSPNAVTVNLSTGTAQDGWGGTDTLLNIEEVRGSDLNDVLTGNAGNNLLLGANGNDALDGGAGIDMAIYLNARSGYTTSKGANGWTVTSSTEGADTLINIERLAFSDQNLALDLSGSTGTAVKLLGALAGSASLQNKALVGQVIGLADQGLSLGDLAALAVSSGVAANLASGADNTSFAKLLMRNLLGSDSNTALLDALTGALSAGAFTQGTLLAAVAALDMNSVNIDLVGLTQSGVAYV